MPRQLKITACITFGLALLFYLFFQTSKQNAVLSPVNAFANDPYDAVGSFGVQLAMFTALLTLIRAFRPYTEKGASENQRLLLLKAASMSCLSVAVTLAADIIAMCRYPSLWLPSSAGHLLAALVGGLALLAAFVGWLLYSNTKTFPILMSTSKSQMVRIAAFILGIVDILILALYPVEIRQGVSGELFTVVVGMSLFLVTVWVMEMALLPAVATHFEDVIDDIAAIYFWLRAHTGPLVVLFRIFEKLQNVSFIRFLLGWLNPRKHNWSLCIVLAILMGATLALAEMLVEGASGRLSQLIMISAIFLSFEAAAVVIGYALLAKPLGLFRHEANEKRVQSVG